MPIYEIDMVLTLHQEGQRVFLAQGLSLPLSSVVHYMHEQLFRVVEFDDIGRVMYLKPEGPAPADAFAQSSTRYAPLLHDIDVRKIVIDEKLVYRRPPTYSSSRSQPPQPGVVQAAEEPPAKHIRFVEKVSCDVRKASFENGSISFEAKLPFSGKTVTIQILNPAIKRYFDPIKNYIWKWMGKKNVESEIEFVLSEGKLSQGEVLQSPLLDLDEDLLIRIEDHWMETNIFSREPDEVRPIDDILTGSANDGITRDWVIAKLINESTAKHYHHLTHLSELHLDDLLKLHITGKPVSFVFVIYHNNHYFMVWETVDSAEATYIWRLGGENHDAFMQEVADTVDTIRELRRKKRNQYLKMNPPHFRRIIHDYQSDLNGFGVWQSDLTRTLEELINTH